MDCKKKEKAINTKNTVNTTNDPSLFGSIPKEILITISEWKVKNGVVLKSSKIQSTSRMHRFKPAVEFGKAIEWVLGHTSENLEASLVFENDCIIIFKNGKYERFENLFDDDD